MQSEEKVRSALRVFNWLSATAKDQPLALQISARAVRDVLRWMLEEDNRFESFLEKGEADTNEVEAKLEEKYGPELTEKLLEKIHA